jgi:hypothetical protein
MRSFILSLAAVAALGLIVPYAAPAKAEETVVVRHGDHGWRHHHHDKVVVIKHHRHDD